MDVDHSGRSLAQKFYCIRDPDYYEFEGELPVEVLKYMLSKSFLNITCNYRLKIQITGIFFLIYQYRFWPFDFKMHVDFLSMFSISLYKPICCEMYHARPIYGRPFVTTQALFFKMAVFVFIAHIFFDDAFDVPDDNHTSVPNEFVAEFVDCIDDALR